MKHSADHPSHDWLREHAARCPDDGTRTFNPTEMAVMNAALDEAYARHRRKGLVWRESELTAIREGRDPAWARFVADSEPEPPRRRHSADDQSLHPATYAAAAVAALFVILACATFAIVTQLPYPTRLWWGLVVLAVFAGVAAVNTHKSTPPADEGRRHNGR